jgi:hypothetical protein
MVAIGPRIGVVAGPGELEVEGLCMSPPSSAADHKYATILFWIVKVSSTCVTNVHSEEWRRLLADEI